jgi:pyruvate/2-oxoglutarate dehydrogenase complex dihydrolipoamide acyltransferase (E2) component
MSSPGYVVRRIPRTRRPVIDRLVGASRRFQVHALLELDVSEAAKRMARAGPHVSWTGFLIATIARAVAAHPDVNARRAGDRIVVFDRIDLGATVERHWEGRTVLDIVTVRDADRQSAAEVSALLRAAKYGPGQSPEPKGMMRMVLRLPGPLRRAAIRLAGRRPRIAASFGPAVGVTSIGMFTRSWGWAIPLAPLTVIATVGGVVDRPVARDGEVVVRPMLPLTLSFDHAVVDGAPATRFTETLRELVETAAVLDDDASTPPAFHDDSHSGA